MARQDPPDRAPQYPEARTALDHLGEQIERVTGRSVHVDMRVGPIDRDGIQGLDHRIGRAGMQVERDRDGLVRITGAERNAERLLRGEIPGGDCRTMKRQIDAVGRLEDRIGQHFGEPGVEDLLLGRTARLDRGAAREKQLNAARLGPLDRTTDLGRRAAHRRRNRGPLQPLPGLKLREANSGRGKGIAFVPETSDGDFHDAPQNVWFF